MREKILAFIEKNSRIDLKELAIVLGVTESTRDAAERYGL